MQPRPGASKEANAKTAQLVKLISEIGPNISEISRRLGQFKESVRYRYKKKIVDKGFSVRAAVDHEKLGLKHLVLVVDFARECRGHARAVLTAMGELCYAVHFAKTLPDGHYLVMAAVPSEFMEDFGRFVQSLGNLGLFASVETLEFEWARNLPMKAEFYDFDVGRWDLDWSSLPKHDHNSADYLPAKPVKFDYVDLVILRELQKDANTTLTEIASQAGVNYQKLAWHYLTHVVGRGLIKSYGLNWMGTSYDSGLEKALQRRHRYVEVVALVRDVNERERIELVADANSLPFLWFEAGGRNYYADFMFPTDDITEAFEYLSTTLAPFDGRCGWHIIDGLNAATFPIAYQLYDRESSRWTFNPQELLPRFEDLLVKAKGAGQVPGGLHHRQ